MIPEWVEKQNAYRVLHSLGLNEYEFNSYARLSLDVLEEMFPSIKELNQADDERRLAGNVNIYSDNWYLNDAQIHEIINSKNKD